MKGFVFLLAIVVDDGSTDNTSEIAIQAGAYIVTCKKNKAMILL
jgi:glycosyltransferase involved in cell wall biosynthesis